MGRLLRTLALCSCLTLPAARALAQSDIDGPDCGRPIQDFGDAPEGHRTVRGRFPTCLAASPPGDQESVCPPRSTPPGLTGYMKHVQNGKANYWLMAVCNQNLSGIDSEIDGKFSAPGAGPSVCDPMVASDPPPITVPFGQDEYSGDDGDTGFYGDLLNPCGDDYVTFYTANCGPPRTAYLNVLVDMNFDGDWNDNVPSCQAGVCAHEWAVKNHAVMVPNGCESHLTPAFAVAPGGGSGAWVRVSLTDGPVDDDFPWAGSAYRAGGAYSGGETEDHTTNIVSGLPVKQSNWGRLKLHYQ